jgi:hypothetical protein
VSLLTAARHCFLVAICLCLTIAIAKSATAQSPDIIRRLPPIDLEPATPTDLSRIDTALRFTSDPSVYRTPEDVLPPDGPHLTSNKSGFFQKLSLTGTHIFRDGSDGVGITETEVFAAFALPAPTTKSPLVLIPTLRMHFLDAPSFARLPPQLYAAYFDFMWLPRVGDRWKGVLSVAPGWYSDFESGSDDGFRLTGRGIARYYWVPETLELILGVLYTNRLNAKVIPAAGLIWKPSDDLNFELVFPRAKIARRLSWGLGFENWVYVGFGFGGDTWSIAAPGGGQETLDMLDWRLTLGWERKTNGGAGVRFEVGYVFARELEFASTATEIKLDDTLLLRGVVVF